MPGERARSHGNEPEELLAATIKDICAVLKQEHEENKKKPAEVGRKEAAYRGCYGAVMMELASRGTMTT